MQYVKGKLIIAGAGPGDPGLITVRAALALREADVILTDRLVNAEIIRQFAGIDALVVEVGKQGGKLHSTPQETINSLIVQYTTSHERVVRLKGGDVSVFANVLDELETCHHHHIPFEIIPGITAASGASAFAGIPLTARGYANAVRYLTYYHSEAISARQWKQLAQTDDTLVFYMSTQSLHELAAQLLQHGMDPAMPVAVIEQATTAAQQVTVSALEQVKDIHIESLRTPSLLVIGKVAALHRSFAWFDAEKAGQQAFRDLPVQTISSLIKIPVA